MKEQDLWSQVLGGLRSPGRRHFSLFEADLFGHLGHTLLLSPPLSCSSKAKLLGTYSSAATPDSDPPDQSGSLPPSGHHQPVPQSSFTEASPMDGSCKHLSWLRA